MANPVKPIPEGYHTITPIIQVEGASEFIDYLKNAFDAKEIHRYADPNGTIMHAEVQIGDSRIMLSDASDDFKAWPVRLQLYVLDVDTTYEKALEAGATSVRQPSDQFYGDRSAGIVDEWGNQWWIGTHKEDLTPEEINKRMKNQK
jgi:uncharacterized glyoxalase superfamily protein PhnB